MSNAAKGLPRQAITLLNRVSDFALIIGENTVKQKTTEYDFDLLQKVNEKPTKEETIAEELYDDV